ncbi:AMP-binding protein [Marinobacter sp.]|uniref:AMP-binding protein n=1 Tax=Marinobacter sp. TaxID=50741 RepID=UPI003B51D9F6
MTDPSTNTVNVFATAEDLWLPGGEPGPGKIARAKLQTDADRDAIQAYQPDQLLPAQTTYECIRAAAVLEPSKAAIVQLLSADTEVAPREISYKRLVDLIEKSANLFRELSQGQPVAVGLMLPMVPEALIGTWGAQTAGIACPINPYLEADVVVSILNSASATVLVTGTSAFGPGCWDKLEEICSRVPSLRKVLLVDSNDDNNEFMRAAEASLGGHLTFDTVEDPNADIMYLPTGGTTGAPKLVRMNHRGQLLNAWSVGAVMGSEQEGVVGHAMPNFHVGGLVVVALRAIIFGQTLVTLTTEGFRNPGVIKHFWDIAKYFKMTSVLATPTTASAILAVPDSNSEGHSLHTFNCGASTVPVELMRSFHRRFGVWLREVWGMSEIHGVVTANRPDGKEPSVGSVGKFLPYHSVTAIEVDDKNNFIRQCAPGERGVLAISGPGIVPGYVEPSLDKEFFVNGAPDNQRLANTGDLGAVDDSGSVWIFGRAKDVIIRGGHNIDPKLVEEVLAGHPDVLSVAAIGRPDPVKGEMPIAYVELKDDSSTTAEELMELCREKVQERAAIPVEIILLEKLPLTAVGKINKPVLRKDAMCRVSESVATRVVGRSGVISVTLEEDGKRPKVCVHIQLKEGNPSQFEAALKTEFAGFTYDTAITIR